MQAPTLLPELKDSKSQRQTMADCQIRTFDVTDQLVIDQFERVPRERFLPDEFRDLAYSDIGFTIPAPAAGGEERYLLTPLVLARLLQGGRVGPGDKVLDVAAGSGYSTAILAGLASDVVALESNAVLRQDLQSRIVSAGLKNVRTLEGPLEKGAPAEGPFDVILVNGAVETGLDALFAQLAEGGRLLTISRLQNDPTGRAAKAVLYEKTGGEVSGRILFDASAPVLPAFKRVPAFVF
jgi:protein-L-isoaspartate(D-aspartate) O-methyltransferase